MQVAGIKPRQRILNGDIAAARAGPRTFGGRRGIDMYLREHDRVIVQPQRHGRRVTTPALGQQLIKADVESRAQRHDAEVAVADAKQFERAPIRADDPAVRRKHDDAFANGSDSFRLRVQVQANFVLATGDKQAVLDHARRDTYKAAGVRMPKAVITGNIQDAGQLATGGHDRCGRAGKEAVALKEVLGAMNLDDFGLSQRRAYRIGSTMLFMPGSAAAQGHAFGLAQEFGIPQRVHQRAAIIGQDDHALRIADLLEQVLHHRARVRKQPMIARKKVAQLATAGLHCLGHAPVSDQARIQAASPGTGNPVVEGIGKAFAMLQQMPARPAQRRHWQGCSHRVSSAGSVPDPFRIAKRKRLAQ
jgi:hypothetical protein